MTPEPRARVASLLASVSEERSQLASKLERSAAFDELVAPVEAASLMFLKGEGLRWCLEAFAENATGFAACVADVLSRADARSPLRLLCWKVRDGDHRIPAASAPSPRSAVVTETPFAKALRWIEYGSAQRLELDHALLELDKIEGLDEAEKRELSVMLERVCAGGGADAAAASRLHVIPGGKAA